MRRKSKGTEGAAAAVYFWKKAVRYGTVRYRNVIIIIIETNLEELLTLSSIIERVESQMLLVALNANERKGGGGGGGEDGIRRESFDNEPRN